MSNINLAFGFADIDSCLKSQKKIESLLKESSCSYSVIYSDRQRELSCPDMQRIVKFLDFISGVFIFAAISGNE